MSKWKNNLRRRRRRLNSPTLGRYQPRRISTNSGSVRFGAIKERLQALHWAKIAKFGFIAALVGSILLFLAIPLLAFNLPSPDSVVRREGFSTKILDRNGEVLYDIYTDERRTPIELEVVPEYLKQATVAVEDKNFYNHPGYDLTAYPRAIFNIVFRGKLQGGSTLTQQLVKNVLLTHDRTIVRKIKEFVLAIQIESRFSKDDILQMYLNEAPYGGTAWGVESASEMYFGKSVSDLNLVESAFMAGLPQSPTRYSPYSSTPDAYIGRTETVLRRMQEDGYITEEQRTQAVDQLDDMEFLPRGASFKAPHFVQYVQEILEERYGERTVQMGGLRVTTTLDLELQEEAQQIVAEEIAEIEDLDVGNGAAVVLNPENGEILAMVGSKDFEDEENDGQVNVALSLRQPGSAIKPITYATGLMKGYTASTLFMDVPTTFPSGPGQPPYEPVNYDGKYRGPVQMRYALANSLNIPAVKMLALVGIEDTLQTAYDLGISSLEPTDEMMSRVGLSLTLGGGEVRLLNLTGAYAAFMNGGHRIDPIGVLKVEDQDGNVLEENKPEKGRQVLSAEQAYIISNILSDNAARTPVFGPNSLLNIPGRQVAVKTGTTNDRRDNWTVGGNPQFVVGVWVGNNDNSPMGQVASGITGATPIWRGIIMEALDGEPNVSFERPDGIVDVDVDSVSGYRAHDGFPSRNEIFEKGTEPGDDPVHVKLKVCKSDNNKLASDLHVSRGDYDEKEFFVFKEEDPTAGAGEENQWQKGILAWIAESGEPKYSPPTEYCDEASVGLFYLEIKEPRDRQSHMSNKVMVKFDVNATKGLKQAKLEVDGQHVRSFTGAPFEHELNLSNGSHIIKVVAEDNEGNSTEDTNTIGVGVPWDHKATPSPTPTADLDIDL